MATEVASAGNDSFSQQINNLSEFVGNILSGASPGSPAGEMNESLVKIHGAIENNDVEKLRALAGSGVDLNQKFEGGINPGHVGITPLALSCALNRAGLVEILLDNGADVNMPFASLNTTALMTSSYHGHVDVVDLLLERGADVQTVDLQQSTALGYAFGGTRNMEVVQLLLHRNIDVNKKNMLGMNALLLVAGYGNVELVDTILKSGADPNATNDFGHTALHLAVVGKRDLLKKLKRLGSAEAAAADRSLNRRNLDVAMQEWARLHKGSVGGEKEKEEALAKAGKFMMSLGQQLEDDTTVDDDREILRRRVEAVCKHRQDKINQAKEKKKSGIWNLLSCGGGKSKQAEESNIGAKPYDQAPEPAGDKAKTDAQDSEVSKLSEGFAQILRLLIDAGCQIDRTEKTFGMTALDLAILNGDVESSAVLISAGGDPDHFLKMLSLKEFYQAFSVGKKKKVPTATLC